MAAKRWPKPSQPIRAPPTPGPGPRAPTSMGRLQAVVRPAPALTVPSDPERWGARCCRRPRDGDQLGTACAALRRVKAPSGRDGLFTDGHRTRSVRLPMQRASPGRTTRTTPLPQRRRRLRITSPGMGEWSSPSERHATQGAGWLDRLPAQRTRRTSKITGLVPPVISARSGCLGTGLSRSSAVRGRWWVPAPPFPTGSGTNDAERMASNQVRDELGVPRPAPRVAIVDRVTSNAHTLETAISWEPRRAPCPIRRGRRWWRNRIRRLCVVTREIVFG
jgi:hypothetical protein